ncbi:MAG: hypothetical protein ACYTAN_16975, partial [Planctomycetota bacterium]
MKAASTDSHGGGNRLHLLAGLIALSSALVVAAAAACLRAAEGIAPPLKVAVSPVAFPHEGGSALVTFDAPLEPAVFSPGTEHYIVGTGGDL